MNKMLRNYPVIDQRHIQGESCTHLRKLGIGTRLRSLFAKEGLNSKYQSVTLVMYHILNQLNFCLTLLIINQLNKTSCE